MSRLSLNGWWRPWWPLVVTVIILLMAGYAGYVRTQAKGCANERRIERVEADMREMREDVSDTREDVSFIRGVIETEFGKETD